MVKTLKDLLPSRGGTTRDEKTRCADEFAESVLSALRGILQARLGNLAAANIDIHTLGSPRDVAEWLASALPASHPFDEFTGPFYDVDGVARRQRTTAADVCKRVEHRKLLACVTAEGTLVFPTCQFNPDGSSVAGLAHILDTMTGATTDSWQFALWMNTPVDELNDRTPAQALQSGDTKIVQEFAEHTAARWRR